LRGGNRRQITTAPDGASNVANQLSCTAVFEGPKKLTAPADYVVEGRQHRDLDGESAP